MSFKPIFNMPKVEIKFVRQFKYCGKKYYYIDGRFLNSKNGEVTGKLLDELKTHLL